MELDDLVERWIAEHESNLKMTDEEFEDSATLIVLEMVIPNADYEELWDFILAAYQKAQSPRALGNISAGPLEDLLAKKGEFYIDRIEELARKDSKFKSLLDGVWQNSTANEVWERVKKARDPVW